MLQPSQVIIVIMILFSIWIIAEFPLVAVILAAVITLSVLIYIFCENQWP